MNPKECINKINILAKRVILFHSANGKDSICLLEMLKDFEQIICVYMYLIKDLEQVDKYISYAEKKYSNCKFVKIPHYALYKSMRFGEIGLKKNSKIPIKNLSQITDEVRAKFGIDYCIFGFKKSDGLNRRLMLNTYHGGCINFVNKKVYPLANWNNKDVLAYIKAKKLLTPVKYNNLKSSDINPKDGAYLDWCRKNYPNDLEKIFKIFPLSKVFLFEYDSKI